MHRGRAQFAGQAGRHQQHLVACRLAVRRLARPGVLRHHASGGQNRRRPRTYRVRLEAAAIRTGADAETPASASVAPAAMDSFYPLTMPLTVGPGSISVAIALGSQRPSAPLEAWQLALLAGSAIVGIVAIAVTVYVCYRFAERIIALLGKSGTNVLVRLSAFILLCIGIQILWAGYSSLTLPQH